MISIKVSADSVISKLTDLQNRQVPYAMKLALNRTGEEIQSAIEDHIGEAFTIRRPWVQKYGVKIGKGDFATKGKLSVTISLNPDMDFLVKFEDGTTKRPREARSLAIPIDARRNKADIVQSSQRPRAFQFHSARTSIASRTTIYQGSNRTFLVQRPDGTGAIFQRLARAQKGKRALPGQDPNLKLLYILRPSAPTPPSLQFIRTGMRVGQQRFAVNLKGMLAYAIATAK
jgi:hypothetical protein